MKTFTEEQVNEIVKAAVLREREFCAKACEEEIEYPAGHKGHWEGYGRIKTQRDGLECAKAIRNRTKFDQWT